MDIFNKGNVLDYINKFSKKNAYILLATMVFGLVLALSEVVMRSYYNISPLSHTLNPLIHGVLLSAIMLFSRSKIVSVLFLIFISFIYSVQYSNLAYFGYWASSMDVWLLFEKINEVTQAGASVIRYQIVSMLMISLIVVASLFILWMRKEVSNKKGWVSVLGVILILFYPIKMTIDKNITLGRLPNVKHSVVKTSLYTLGYFISHTLPEEILGYSKVASTVRSAPERISPIMSENIIVVMGESLSSSYMSAYGFNKATTPWLDKEIKKPNRFISNGFSGGLFTDVSVPFFFNIIEKPNARKQISQGNTNLFRLAKEQGYKTHFYSAQMSSGLSFISMLGKQWIDKYHDSLSFTHDVNVPVDDKELVTWLSNASLGDKNFIVLNQNGSHEPYIDRSPLDKKIFGQDGLYNEYLNSVYYTDEVLKNIQQVIETLPGTWTLIFTSDHGQNVTHTSAGKGSFTHLNNYLVPVYIASNKNAVIELTNKRFGSCKRTFQVQLSGLISEFMGYKNNNTSCDIGFVSGKRLTGNSGYMKLTRESNDEYIKEVLYQ